MNSRTLISLGVLCCALSILNYLGKPSKLVTDQSILKAGAAMTSQNLDLSNPPAYSPRASRPPSHAFSATPVSQVSPEKSLDRYQFGNSWGREDLKELSDFSSWATDYVKHQDPAQRSAMEAEGISLAKTRRSALKKLIESNPKMALAVTVPYSIRSQFPQSIQGQLESRVSGKGNLNVLAQTPLPGATEPIRPYMHRAVFLNHTYDAFPYGNMEQMSTTSDISMHGIALANSLALADASVRLLDPGEPYSADKVFMGGSCPVSATPIDRAPETPVAESGDEVYLLCDSSHVTELEGKVNVSEGGKRRFRKQAFEADGVKSVLFVRVDFPDVPGEPISSEDASVGMKSLTEFFLKNSFGKLQFSNSVITPVFRMSLPSTNYVGGANGAEELLAEAGSAAEAAGFKTVNFQHHLLMFKDIGFPWGGLGFVGYKGSWVQGPNIGIAAHELGHNLGLNHSGLWVSTNIIGPGSRIEYGNAFSTMGKSSAYPLAHFTADAKAFLKWLPSAQIHTATANTTVRLYAHDLAGDLDASRLYGIKIPAGKGILNESVDYWVEFRQLFADNESSSNGALILWGNDAGSEKASSLLDMTPGTREDADDAEDAALLVGKSFSDPGRGITVRVEGKGGTGADRYLDIGIAYGAPPAITIADGLDAPAYSWRSGGESPWMGVSNQNHDGIDAAGSGKISENQSSWVETTVTGPGLLSFWWKVFSESNSDTLSITVNAAPVGGDSAIAPISGLVDWQQKSITLPPGDHVVRWTYAKNGQSSELAADAGWIDQVSFTPSGQPPRITYQPAALTVAEGQPATFVVAVGGGAPSAFQWLKNDAPIAGAIRPNYTLPSAQLADAGNYSVHVSNAAGGTTSSKALLTVIRPISLENALDTTELNWSSGGDGWLGQTTVSHDAQDAAQSKTTGNASESWIETAITGPGILQFWWKVSSEANRDILKLAVDGATQPGAISGQLDWQEREVAISAGNHTIRWTYSKDSIGESGQDRAWVDQVTFKRGGNPPFIITQPVDVSTTVGGSARFTVAASGSQPMSYQWLKDGRPIPAGTNATLVINDAQPESSGAYLVQLINGAGSATSRTAALKIGGIVPLTEALDATSLVWTTGGIGSWTGQNAVTHDDQDAAQSAPLADDQESWIQTTLTGPGTLTFWWKVSSEPEYDIFEVSMDGTPLSHGISGEEDWTRPSIEVPAGDHTIRWRFAKDGLTSGGKDRAWLDEVAFVREGSPPTITLHPQNLVLTSGAKADLFVTAAGDGPLSYQWRKGGTDIAGANKGTYSIAAVTTADAGSYDVVINNPNGSVTSQPSILNVLALLTLKQALDADTLVWTTGGTVPWTPQTTVTQDKNAAAVSGSITNSQETWIETTITGPTELSFWWKVSSEDGYDQLELLMDGTSVTDPISGEIHWRQNAVSIPAGSHVLRWNYKKDDTASVGEDRAWVDKVTISAPYSPANDNFNDRIDLANDNPTASAVNTLATKETGEPIHAANSGGKSLWWTWTEIANRTVVITTEGSSLNTLLAVYTGDTLGELTLVAQNDDINEENTASSVTFQSKAGTVYQIAVDGYLDVGNPQATVSSGVINLLIGEPPSILSVAATPKSNPALGQVLTFSVQAVSSTPLTYYWVHNDSYIANDARIQGATTPTLTINNAALSDEGTYSVLVVNAASTEISEPIKVLFSNIPRPVNDNFQDAAVLAGNSVSILATNLTATVEVEEPYHANSYGGRSLWWKWSTPSATQVSINTLGSGFDTLLAVYTGTSLANLVEIASNDDNDDANETSVLSFTSVANAIYYIVVDGFQGQSGNVATGPIHLNISTVGEPVLTGIRWRQPVQNASGSIEFTFEDAQGGQFTASDISRFEIQTSSNLSTWTSLSTSPTTDNGRIVFTVANPLTDGSRFYRVKKR